MGIISWVVVGVIGGALACYLARRMTGRDGDLRLIETNEVDQLPPRHVKAVADFLVEVHFIIVAT